MKLTIREAIKVSGVTQRAIAEELGVSTQALQSNLNRDMKVSTLKRISEVCGYKVCLVKDERVIEI